ncbi:MAG: ROK family transcriptional regulator [Anaerolineae bacterium]
MNHVGDGSLLRKVNQSAILELIREHGPISRSEIARLLHISPATVTRIVTELLTARVIQEKGARLAPFGRRPILLEFNPRASLIIGVYVHRDMVGAVSDLNGEILRRTVQPAQPGEAGIQQLIALVRALYEMARRYALPVRGVGIGAPSIVSYREGVVAWAPSLGWRNVPLKALVEQAVGLPVFVENEVNLIALGESWRGAGRDVDNLVCISLGAGIGAGIVLSGFLYRGAHCAAGEIGYLLPSAQHLGHHYESFGCLEGLAGSVGIVRRAQEKLATGQRSILQEWPDKEGAPLTAEMVLRAARKGDPCACQVVDEVADYLALAVASVSCVLDPHRIIFSGDLVEFADMFVERIAARLNGALPTMPELVVSQLGTDAAVLGALAMALFETDEGVFVQKVQA